MTDAISTRRTARLSRGALLAGLLAMLPLAVAAPSALAAPGDLDPGFDRDGRVTLDHGGLESARAVELQPDGKIVVAGSTLDRSTRLRDFVVSRLQPDGSRDTSFDGDGTVRVDVDRSEGATAVTVQPDGKIVVAGYTSRGGSPDDFVLLRFNPDGSRDTSFDGDGTVRLDLGGYDVATALALQPNGRLVVAGHTYTAGTARDFVVARLNPNGSRDTGFDGDGSVRVDFGASDDYGYALALGREAGIVIAGYTYRDGDQADFARRGDFALLRLNANGSRDVSFDGDGIASVDLGGADVARALALQPDGKLVVAGHTAVVTAPNGGAVASKVAVARLNPNGSLDISFDGDGAARPDFGGYDGGAAVTLRPDGRIVVVGDSIADGNPGSASDFAIARLQPSGGLDTSFSSDGTNTVSFGASAAADDLALQPDGKIVVAGGSGGDVAVARLEGDPPPPVVAPPPAQGRPGGSVLGRPRCAGRRATIVGTQRREVIRGTRRADVIVALGGDDTISGGRGDDLVCAGPGADRVDGGGGSDRLSGQQGDDRLSGQQGDDRLSGQQGDDRLSGQHGDDRLRGGRGADRLDGGKGRDRLLGQAGDDRLRGGIGADRLDGGPGRDRLSGQQGDDRLRGGPGADRLDGGTGRDRCDGGPGRDRANCERNA